MDPSRILKEFLEALNPNHTGSKYWPITRNETETQATTQVLFLNEGLSGCYGCQITESCLVPPSTTCLVLQEELD